jgi:hypothetical protein
VLTDDETVRPVIAIALSDRNPLHLIKAHIVAPAIVELRRSPWRRHFRSPAIFV